MLESISLLVPVFFVFPAFCQCLPWSRTILCLNIAAMTRVFEKTRAWIRVQDPEQSFDPVGNCPSDYSCGFDFLQLSGSLNGYSVTVNIQRHSINSYFKLKEGRNR